MKTRISFITLVYAGALILLGLVGYLVTGLQSLTALIPAVFGALVLVVMLLTRRQQRTSVLVWSLVVLAGIGFLATMTGVPRVLEMATGGEVARPAAAVSQALMCLGSLVFGLSLLNARRKAA